MGRFKVGDKVIITNPEQRCDFRFKGNIVTINEIDEDDDERYLVKENHRPWLDNELEFAKEQKPFVEINENGIFVNGQDSIDAMRYAVDDIIDTKKYDMYVKGIWKNKEEKDMNKVLELYAKRKREEIDKKYNEKVEKDYNELELVKQYKEIVKDFESKMDELYNNELNAGESTIHQCYNINDYKYELKYDLKNSISDVYDKERSEEIKAINDLVEEVEAQLSLSDDLEYQREVLTAYGIVDKKSGKIK